MRVCIPQHEVTAMKVAALLLAFIAAASAFQLQKPTMPEVRQALTTAAQAATAAAVTFHSEAAHAKSVLGVNGALDFGPLAGDQPGYVLSS